MFGFLYPEQMEKVRIIVPYALKDRMVDALYSLNILDLRNSTLNLPNAPSPADYGELQGLYTKLEELIKLLPKKKVTKKKSLGIKEVIKRASKEIEIFEKAEHISAEEKKLEQEERSPDHKRLKARIKKRIEKEAAELDKMSEEHYSNLMNLREMLKIELGKENAYAFLKKTKDTALIEGWLPKKRMKELRSKLNKATSGLCSIEIIGTLELPPTYINSTGIMSSFDYVVNLFSLPRSDEINPAWFLMFSFPVLYGLMISDVGYGLVSLILSIIIVRLTDKKGLYHNLANVWLVSSLFTIFFGILNNQYFGIALDQYLFPFFSGFDWKSNMLTVVAVSILVGIFEIGVGIMLGIINAYNHSDRRLMLFKFLLLTALLSGTILMTSALGLLNGSYVGISALALLISIFGMVLSKPSSSGRILDLITYPLSYVRIMGFGIVSVILASLIDNAFLPNPSSGIIIFVVYVVIYMVLHLLNMALSTFEAGIQSFRLNFIEFFDQFYTGKGVKYNPFGYERVYTTE